MFCKESIECINFQLESLVKVLNLTVTEGGALVLINHLEDWLGLWEIMDSGIIAMRMAIGGSLPTLTRYTYKSVICPR